MVIAYHLLGFTGLWAPSVIIKFATHFLFVAIIADLFNIEDDICTCSLQLLLRQLVRVRLN